MCVRFSRFIPLKQSIFLPFKKERRPRHHVSDLVRSPGIHSRLWSAFIRWYRYYLGTNLKILIKMNSLSLGVGGGDSEQFSWRILNSLTFRGKLLGHPLIHGRKDKPPDICFYSCDSNNELIKSCGDCRNCERCIHGILGGKRVSLWGDESFFFFMFFHFMSQSISLLSSIKIREIMGKTSREQRKCCKLNFPRVRGI